MVDQLLADDALSPDPALWERDMAEAAEAFDDGDRAPVNPWEPRSR
ncbi:hypothetical protein [Pseudonocardia asaccharolytica]|nr:hypothetical protein [Pseudonocardia asaccharolytica]